MAKNDEAKTTPPTGTPPAPGAAKAPESGAPEKTADKAAEGAEKGKPGPKPKAEKTADQEDGAETPKPKKPEKPVSMNALALAVQLYAGTGKPVAHIVKVARKMEAALNGEETGEE